LPRANCEPSSAPRFSRNELSLGLVAVLHIRSNGEAALQDDFAKREYRYIGNTQRAQTPSLIFREREDMQEGSIRRTYPAIAVSGR